MSSILPYKLLQMVHCTHWNKNSYVLAYLQKLVACWRAMDNIISFMPVRHKHWDIDQSISCMPGLLKARDAMKLENFHSKLCDVYNKETRVYSLDQIGISSGLCMKQRRLKLLETISHFRQFMFYGRPGCDHPIFSQQLASLKTATLDWVLLHHYEDISRK